MTAPSCRYYISTRASLIRLYVDRPYWEAFNVDGRRCDNIVECEVYSRDACCLLHSSQVRSLTTNSSECPHDWVKLYDGVDEFSPLIGQFCGVGRCLDYICVSSNYCLF